MCSPWGQNCERHRQGGQRGRVSLATTALPSSFPFPKECPHQRAASLALTVGGCQEVVRNKMSPLVQRAYTGTREIAERCAQQRYTHGCVHGAVCTPGGLLSTNTHRVVAKQRIRQTSASGMMAGQYSEGPSFLKNNWIWLKYNFLEYACDHEKSGKSPRTPFSAHIHNSVVKLKNTKDKEKILKVSRKRSQIAYEGITIRLRANFPIATMKSSKPLNNIFEIYIEKITISLELCT